MAVQVEGLRLLIVLFEEAVDRVRVSDRRLEPAVRVAKKPSTALSQEADVGVNASVGVQAIGGRWDTYGRRIVDDGSSFNGNLLLVMRKRMNS